jgi:hypothetical protein
MASISKASRAIAPGIQFAVSDVVPATVALSEASYKEAVESLLKSPPPRFKPQPLEDSADTFRTVEACARYHGKLVAGVQYHPVVAAIHHAFSDHRPLVLSPDMIWVLIAQGFANHVNGNSEELRPLFIAHSGQLRIEVKRDDFVKGSPENPWTEVFSAFSKSIAKHLGATTHELLLPQFSTTGVNERAAAEIVLLDAMQSYFTYVLKTRCGIPHITLEGTSDDWDVLLHRVKRLSQYKLKWWIDLLVPILNQFTEASQGRANPAFWQSIYKENGGSGGPYISGWINAFFPYLKDWKTGKASRQNDWLTKGDRTLQQLVNGGTERESPDFFRGICGEQIPGGLSKTPFVWEYLGRTIPMEFLGGFVGVKQGSESLSLRPEIGWAIREAAAA